MEFTRWTRSPLWLADTICQSRCSRSPLHVRGECFVCCQKKGGKLPVVFSFYFATVSPRAFLLYFAVTAFGFRRLLRSSPHLFISDRNVGRDSSASVRFPFALQRCILRSRPHQIQGSAGDRVILLIRGLGLRRKEKRRNRVPTRWRGQT